MKKNGGYIFASDHSISEDITVEDFRDMVRLVKKVEVYS